MRIDTRISRPKSFYNTNEYPDNQLKLFGETADITNIREKLYLVCNQDTSRKYYKSYSKYGKYGYYKKYYKRSHEAEKK